jgi:carboxyl-terminal processing protease
MKQPPYLPKQKSSTPKYIGFMVLLFFVFTLGWNVGVNHVNQQKKIVSTNLVISPLGELETIDMRLFWDTWNILNGKYVDPHTLDSQEMVYGAIRGMVSALDDPYTTFMTPKENKEFQDSLEGTLEGIGAELILRHGLLTVISPLKNSPAKKAGLQPEDIIIAVDGESTEDISLEQAVTKIRGEKGSPVTLTISRKKHNEPIDITITRETINIESVTWAMEDNIAIVELNQFGNNTKQEFSKTINEVLNERPDGMVLDLRYNGGGYLDGAVDIVSEFIEKGEVVTIKRRNPENDETIFVNGQARVVNLPLAVLINKGSASASEIVAGAIQDHERGIVIGENSFGKGTVQEVENLIGGSSLRVTVAEWFTPNGRNITEEGITPNEIIERTVDDIENNEDPQLNAAMEHLKSLDK